MANWFKILTLASATLSVPALAQSVEIKTGPNGQLSGKSEAGGLSSSVDTGTMSATSGRTDDGDGHVATRTGSCLPGSRSRGVRVVSPDGSSSSSVSVSGGGTVAVGGGGSPGSRVYEENCPDEPASIAPRQTVHRRHVHHRVR